MVANYLDLYKYTLNRIKSYSFTYYSIEITKIEFKLKMRI